MNTLHQPKLFQEVPSGHATFSPDRVYRYALWRSLNGEAVGNLAKPERRVNFVMLNPSTADESEDDPSIRRCMDYGKKWGYSEVVVTNLFGYRATDPKIMKAARDPIGPNNDLWIVRMAQGSSCTVAAWGTHGNYGARSDFVRDMLKEAGVHLNVIRLTKNGCPSHPLYLPANLMPIAF